MIVIAKYRIILFSILILITTFSHAQNDSISKIDNTYPSFRSKTELVNLIGLKPNVYFEYKACKRIGFSLGAIVHLNGLIWSAPYISPNLYKWWILKGIGLDVGLKYYSAPTKYYALRFTYDYLSCNGRLEGGETKYAQYGSIKRKDLYIKLLRGFESKNLTRTFREFYFGIGMLIISENYNYGTYDPGYHGLVNIQDINYNHIVPTFHIGFNIGIKTNFKQKQR